MAETGLSASYPALSTDGTYIVFESQNSPASQYSLNIMPIISSEGVVSFASMKEQDGFYISPAFYADSIVIFVQHERNDLPHDHMYLYDTKSQQTRLVANGTFGASISCANGVACIESFPNMLVYKHNIVTETYIGDLSYGQVNPYLSNDGRYILTNGILADLDSGYCTWILRDDEIIWGSVSSMDNDKKYIATNIYKID